MAGTPETIETFKCVICAKTLSSKKARHISYCRRTHSRIRSRRKACFYCARAKTHCDLIQPSCSRCTSKKLNCGYEQPRPSKIPVTLPQTAESTEQSVIPIPDVDFGSPWIAWENVEILNPLDDSANESANLVSSGISNYERWNLDGSELVGGIQNDFINESTIQNQSRPQHSIFEVDSPMDVSNIDFADTSWLSPIMPRAPKLFGQRKRDNQLSLNKNYLLCSLRTYPHMMLPGKSLPPFIHPTSMIDMQREDRTTQKTLPGPLANCAAIVQMYSVKNNSNAVFIWKAVRMEQERISAEYMKYDDWNTVAALQAITVYFLLRLSEDNDEATNFDVPLINTMVKLALKVMGLTTKYEYPSEGATPTWKGWGLAESLRRTIIVLFLVDMFFDYSSALHYYRCDGSILKSMALPCARDLWRATTSAEWKQEFASRSEEIGPKTQLTYGDLLNFRSRADRRLDSWLSQLDDFGSLVMAAANLTESIIPRQSA
ncbi:hypothetical protein BJ875DRAFT_113309 [Amylocarpus encephaloides]|uniref:Zn(2)-C6 fungal-type domain-containing protein n=1 Tax=Amylocarpus encephaloides TaxID=45428 RepID=A0A9P7YCW2_9HELO|nr:hypothetical protein BJ875DRAFT_113309 [Amylocarpus encephaloides]